MESLNDIIWKIIGNGYIYKDFGWLRNRDMFSLKLDETIIYWEKNVNSMSN